MQDWGGGWCWYNSGICQEIKKGSFVDTSPSQIRRPRRRTPALVDVFRVITSSYSNSHNQKAPIFDRGPR